LNKYLSIESSKYHFISYYHYIILSTIILGNTHRYGSTHRVVKTEGHTYQSIYQRCFKQVNSKLICTERIIRLEMLCLIEVEFEWLRQFYIQGNRIMFS